MTSSTLSEPTSALPPPPGVTSNFSHPETLWKWDVLCVTICLVFTTIPFMLRTYVRLFLKRQWLFEDYMACLSWAGLVTYCALMTTVMDRHGGVHQWDLTVPEVEQALYWFNVTSIEYGIEILITKLTILLMYRRVFVPHRGSIFDVILRGFATILILFYVAITLVKIFECTPRARIWNRKLPGTCTNISAILNTSGLFNFITDVLILLIPVRSVWNLQMKRKKKVGVVALFTVGLIAPVFSMIGFVVRLRDSGDPDQTYNQPFVLLWGTAEVSTGNICIFLPPVAVLLRSSQRRPAAGGHGGDFNSRHLQSSRRKQASPRDKSDLYHEEYLKLSEFGCDTVGIEVPPGVVTNIEGGTQKPIMQDGNDGVHGTAVANSTDGIYESTPAANIMKTVKVEHSYV